MSRTSFALLSATKIGALGHPTSAPGADANEALALQKTVSATSSSGSGSGRPKRPKRFSFLHSRTNSDSSQFSQSSELDGSGSAISIEPSTPPFSPVDDGYLRTAWDADVDAGRGGGRLSPQMAAKEERSRRYSAGMVQAHSYTSGHSYLKVDWNNPATGPAVPPAGPAVGAGNVNVVSAEEFNRALRQRSPSGGSMSMSLTPPVPASPSIPPAPWHAPVAGPVPMPMPMPYPSLTPSLSSSFSPCTTTHTQGYSQLNTTLTHPDACLRRASHNDAVNPNASGQPRRRVTQYGYDQLVPADMGAMQLQQALARDARRY